MVITIKYTVFLFFVNSYILLFYTGFWVYGGYRFSFLDFLGDIHGNVANIHHIKELHKARGIVISGDIGKSSSLQDSVNVLKALTIYNKVILAQIGNMDGFRVDVYLSELNINLHKNSMVHDNILFMGVGGSLPTPFATKSEFTEDFYVQELKKFALLPKQDITVLVSHNPPLDTVCDKLKSGKHVGCKAVLEFIRDYQPDFCVCGHIHESRAKEKIGRTWVCNLGDFASGYYGKLICSDKPEMELCTIFN